MKNRFFIITIILIQNLIAGYVFGEEFKFEAEEIEVLKKGNLVKAKGGVIIISSDGTEIQGDESLYNKSNLILKVFGNVIVDDTANNIKINAENITYDKKQEIIQIYKDVTIYDDLNDIIINSQNVTYDKKKEIIQVYQDVIVDDKLNGIEIDAQNVTYNKKLNIISSEGKTLAKVKNQYKIKSSDLFHDRNKMKIYSDKKTVIEDNLGNVFKLGAFKFDIIKKLLKAKKITLFDNKNNKYYLENSQVDLENNEIVGKDINIDFDNSLFGNDKNEPRLKGKSVISNSQETIVYKGVFTTCKKTEKKCPPWSIYADQVTHKKKQKLIEYRNAWLEIYDKPIIYFPYFFHPDPTVKRQSGFLMPTLQSSNISGQSIQIPYYKVIAENKDLTVSPRVFFDKDMILQSEYRQANKNSNLFLDFSINPEKGETKTHFFSDLSGNFKDSNYKIKLESVSNDNYLKLHKIKSPLINDYSTLNSYLNYENYKEDQSLTASFEVFEDLTKIKSDRYEYIYPNYNFEKKLNISGNYDGELNFESQGFQKKFNTNIYEALIVNDFKYISNENILMNGLKNNYTALLRNVNTNSENSLKYKNDTDNKLLSMFVFETKYPLKKKDIKYDSYLMPILSARYSPSATKNYTNLNRRLDYNNIFSLDRLGEKDMVEGGQSLTLGLEYSKKDKKNQDYLNLSVANVIRDKRNPDLPVKSSIAETRSDLIGKLDFIPSKFFDFEYEFSVDKNLGHSNFNFVKTNFRVNNIVTSFEFLEEDNFIGEKSYLSNKTSFNFDDRNSISFGTSKNLDKNITEYYNLIYEYKNDCLIAAVEYDKQYYTDNELKPEQNLFLSIKIIPFGKIDTPSIK